MLYPDKASGYKYYIHMVTASAMSHTIHKNLQTIKYN